MVEIGIAIVILIFFCITCASRTAASAWKIFEIDDNAYWYVAEKVQTGNNDAMDKALNFIDWLDYSDNAGYDKNGKLTIPDKTNNKRDDWKTSYKNIINDLKYLLENGII